jgi:hypothetical protein
MGSGTNEDERPRESEIVACEFAQEVEEDAGYDQGGEELGGT